MILKHLLKPKQTLTQNLKTLYIDKQILSSWQKSSMRQAAKKECKAMYDIKLYVSSTNPLCALRSTLAYSASCFCTIALCPLSTSPFLTSGEHRIQNYDIRSAELSAVSKQLANYTEWTCVLSVLPAVGTLVCTRGPCCTAALTPGTYRLRASSVTWSNQTSDCVKHIEIC